MHIRAKELQVVFPVLDGGVVPALGPISFEIAEGTFVSLLGPSGCGKSTLIRAVAGLVPATNGKVWRDGHVVADTSDKIGLMFQSANLMDWRTVLDNVALPLELQGIPKAESSPLIEQLLKALGLEEFASAYPKQLSGGMAQRVALGRVIIQNPELLLLDEPFGALDAMTREHIRIDLLRLWAERKQTVLMVTHDIHEAVLMSDRILILSQRPGRLVADIDVHLPRPRDLEMIYDPQFIDIARQVRQYIDTA